MPMGSATPATAALLVDCFRLPTARIFWERGFACRGFVRMPPAASVAKRCQSWNGASDLRGRLKIRTKKATSHRRRGERSRIHEHGFTQMNEAAPLFSSVFYPCQSVAWDFSWTPDLSGLLGSEASAMPAGPASRITAVWYSSR